MMQATTHGTRWGASGAGCYVVAATTGRVLLVRRSRCVNEPLLWGIPGGAVNVGESAHAAALRETEEEVGQLPEVLFVAEAPRFVATDGWVFRNFVVLVADEFAPALDWENEGSAWTTPGGDLLERDLHPGVRWFLRVA